MIHGAPSLNVARPLADGYTVSVDEVTADSWSETLRQFDDANIFQTWAYGEVRQGRRNLSHLVLRRGGETVAAVQLRLFQVPLRLLGGIAHVRGGPVWITSGGKTTVEDFRQITRALRNEYVVRRRMLLRILPRIHDETGDFARALQEEGFGRVRRAENTRTLLISLDRSLDELRKGLAPKWRSDLSRAMRNDLQIVCGQEGALFDEFIAMYEEMRNRKGFGDPTDVREYRDIQARLPEDVKMMVFMCRAGGQPGAAAIVSAIGTTGLFLFGASNELGRETRGSFLVHWRVLEWLKELGCRQYDLHGINPATNPGTYHFKAGLCGKRNGEDVTFLGSFESHGASVGSRTILLLERLRQAWRSTWYRAVRATSR